MKERVPGASLHFTGLGYCVDQPGIQEDQRRIEAGAAGTGLAG